MNRGALRKGFNQLAAIAVFGLAFSAAAMAQSSSGNLIGEGKAGDTVIISGPDNGFHREMELKEDGKYQMRRIPLGDYTVVIKHADGSFSAPKTVSVRVGSTARVQ
ncbi:carboxypeptidase-like regulatory domain-containing protein [Luteimonas sp. SX5]|uniref:Carboxypeptidase-like regulatory domain-containing protein n=1 Tax=Luteimonas galliterrae TaxID=2940486 RepID=A0ABT0MHQ9_9GAMM|nr:carboxypeptidase-like regulatory domain-containing protein [Luteimonas galliterrae]MCL1634138.1 carboxypeptidase-like regulatory domain-containing protein [Luteimonas galliterrae]